MAIRDEKQNFLSVSEITVDLPRVDGSKIKNALATLINKLKAIRLTKAATDPSNFDVDVAREQYSANINNTANLAHLYSRRF